jgi:GNAT superfamily N-acetyltransferase
MSPGLYPEHDRFWTEFLGLGDGAWPTAGVAVTAHAGLSGFSGVWFFERDERVVVSAPPAWVRHLSERLSGSRPLEALTSDGKLGELFGAALGLRIGPAFQGALAPGHFNPYVSPRVKWPSADDASVQPALEAHCSAKEVEHAGLSQAQEFRASFWSSGEVVALSGYRAWSERAGDPCVLTHPSYRGRGCGAAAVSSTVARAIAADKLLLFQTLESNRAAVKLALGLGYRRYARHVAVRLERDAP